MDWNLQLKMQLYRVKFKNLIFSAASGQFDERRFEKNIFDERLYDKIKFDEKTILGPSNLSKSSIWRKTYWNQIDEKYIFHKIALFF